MKAHAIKQMMHAGSNAVVAVPYDNLEWYEFDDTVLWMLNQTQEVLIPIEISVHDRHNCKKNGEVTERFPQVFQHAPAHVELCQDIGEEKVSFTFENMCNGETKRESWCRKSRLMYKGASQTDSFIETFVPTFCGLIPLHITRHGASSAVKPCVVNPQ